jgi:hypothetical protein
MNPQNLQLGFWHWPSESNAKPQLQQNAADGLAAATAVSPFTV